MKTIAIFFTLLFNLSMLSVASARTITTPNGQKIEVKLLKLEGNDNVRVRLKNGEEMSVPLARLSQADQKAIRAELAPKKSKLKNAPEMSAKKPEARSSSKTKSSKRIAKKAPEPQIPAPVKKGPPAYKIKATSNDGVLAAAKKIDQLIADSLQAKGIKPQPIADDATFMRRAYLSIIGRIPTHEEATTFFEDQSSDKRHELIDHLMDQPGYVHHRFNYWADLLRVKTRLQGRNYGGAYYANWVKEALATNMPYDRFVKEMLSAEGYYWDNPAVGYHRRDKGMPLDNMATTAEIFLGTSMVCAQCHDHPFDTWTQKEYYEMAAYTFPMRTQMQYREIDNVKMAHQELNPMAAHMKKMDRGKKLSKEKRAEIQKQARETMAQYRRGIQYTISYPLNSGNNESANRTLKYPADYQYSNAKPNQPVAASTPFGREVELQKGDSPIQKYANWFTSKDNPRFGANMVNRMWKEVFGVAQVEPVNDLKFDSEAFQPEVFEFANELFKEMNFDLKRFQKVLFKTQLFQRECITKEFDPSGSYDFAGPQLRRMSAEQMWDSLMTLAVPEIDGRLNPTMLRTDAAIEREGRWTLDAEPKEIAEKVKRLSDPVEEKAYRKEMASGGGMMSMMARPAMEMTPGSRRNPLDKLYNTQYFRAAELPSPARAGHFLNQFGQSDRLIPENEMDDATVPQVLTLMNGNLIDSIIKNPSSQLRRTLDGYGKPANILNALYISTYGREPSPEEARISEEQIAYDADRGIERLTWAILNSRKFIFIQ